MRVLVTGGAGFVGSVCCAELVRRGYSVVVVDDLSAGHAEAIPKGVEFYRCDIGDRHTIGELLRSRPVDVVFHFAAKALIAESMANPGFFFQHNVAAGISFLETLREGGVKRFVFSSSAAVYGNPRQIPIPEDHPKEPVNSYGATKAMFENILEWYSKAYGWTVLSFRYFNACGATKEIGEDHRPETHIIPVLLRAAMDTKRKFQVYGNDYQTPDGTCLRDYVHVQDIATAHLLALEELDGYHAYNIGTGHSYSVLEVCRAVEHVTGKRVVVDFAPRRPGDPSVLCASPEKLKRKLGWRPQNSELHSIISDAWTWMQQHPNGYAVSNADLTVSAP